LVADTSPLISIQTVLVDRDRHQTSLEIRLIGNLFN